MKNKSEIVKNKVNMLMLQECTAKITHVDVLSGINFGKKEACSIDGSRLFACDKPIDIEGLFKPSLHEKIEGKFPEYTKLIPKKIKKKVKISLDRRQIKGVLSYLKGLPVNAQGIVTFTSCNKTIKLSCKNIEYLEVIQSTEFKCDDDLPEITFSLNVDYLISYLKAFDSLKNKEINDYTPFNFYICNDNHLAPVVIKAGLDKELFHTYLIMPMDMRERR